MRPPKGRVTLCPPDRRPLGEALKGSLGFHFYVSASATFGKISRGSDDHLMENFHKLDVADHRDRDRDRAGVPAPARGLPVPVSRSEVAW